MLLSYSWALCYAMIRLFSVIGGFSINVFVTVSQLDSD